jgi:1-phosphofructokinase
MRGRRRSPDAFWFCHEQEVMFSSHVAVTVTLNPAIDLTLSIPHFATGQVNCVGANRTTAGGKGVNVAGFLADLGISVVATGFLGRSNAKQFEELFQQKGIADRFIRIPGSARLNLKIVDEDTQETTDINFPGLTPPTGVIEDLVSMIASYSGPGRWFALSGSVPPGVALDIYARLAKRIRAAGGRVAVDTSQEPLREALECSLDVVKPNVAELEQLIGHRLGTPTEVAEVARSLQQKGVELVVVSMGEQGAIFADRTAIVLGRPPRVSVHSTAGAGDAMVSGVLYSQMQRYTLTECARLATALGAYAVSHRGADLDRTRLEVYREQVVVEDMKIL